MPKTAPPPAAVNHHSGWLAAKPQFHEARDLLAATDREIPTHLHITLTLIPPPCMDAQPPHFSVVISLYNKASYVCRAISSAIQQTHPPREIIVIDDGSTDDSADVVKKRFPDVTLLTQPNQGAGAARNHGIAHASSEWVALLDADDFWLPRHLAELARVILAEPRANLVASQFIEIREGQCPRTADREHGRIRVIDYFREASHSPGVVWTSATALRRSTLEHVGGFQVIKTGPEDTELWARVALMHPVATSTAKTAVYVRGVGGAMETKERSPETRPIPSALADIGPYCATVVEALTTGRHIVPESSLISYLNGWVIRKMRQAIVRGDGRRAAALRRLVISPVPLRYAPYLLASYLPNLLIRPFLDSRRALRRAILHSGD